MSSKKRKSSSTSSSSSSQQQRLFSTLASIEQTDARATQKRKQSHISSLSQSRAANDQVKLNAILLELRILMQRCLDVGDDVLSNSQSSATAAHDDVQVEIDSLLENLLIARRELLGNDMNNQSDNDDHDHDDGSDEDGDDVDYAALIRQNKDKSKDDDDDDDSNSSTDNSSSGSNGSNTNLLSTQLQNEYESLRTSWKSILNKHHSNLALHSGMSVNSSKFQSKAVDLSFWEQVNFVTSQTTSAHNGRGDTEKDKGIKGYFDDSKLYQQMLKDFISQSSSGSGGGGSSGGKRLGSSIDPAQEAAERLKRAMRKKNGVEGDVDLSTLLLPTQDGGSTKDNTNAAAAAASAKKANLDRRASKGRKIRYTVHPKLVNFTFPVARPEPMIKEDIWFKSLFGGVGKF